MQLLAKSLPATGIFTTSRLDGAVLLFTLLMSLAPGSIFGMVPALSMTRAGIAGVLQEARTAGRSLRRVTVANALLVAQVALSFLLLVTAALFLRSIQQAYQIDPGFKADRLAVFLTNPGQAGYEDAETHAFYVDVADRVTRMPGVESVAWASNMPLFARPLAGLQVEGRSRQSPADQWTTIVNTVSLGYFKTSGIAIEEWARLRGPRPVDVDSRGDRERTVRQRLLARQGRIGQALASTRRTSDATDCRCGANCELLVVG